MNKKISKLLENNYTLYFVGMTLLTIPLFQMKIWVGISALAVMVTIYFVQRSISEKKRQQVMQYIDTVTGGLFSSGQSNLLDSPVPIMVYSADTKEIIWANESFVAASQLSDDLYNLSVEEAVPGYDGRWAMEGKTECPQIIKWNDRFYHVVGNAIRSGEDRSHLLIASYWLDVTEKEEVKQRFEDTRPVISILMIDNYDEITKVSSEANKSILLAQIDNVIGDWANKTPGIFLRYDRNRYLFIYEETEYQKMTQDHYAVIDRVREVVNEDGVAATMSIGVGKEAANFQEGIQFANLAIEMALSRGGDQVVVRTPKDFEFFGGHAKSNEKRTKVKSRVMANALGELISESQYVYIMGHKYADMDAVGAAAGIFCVARKKGKKAQIILDEDNNASQLLVEYLKTLPEYEGAFISGNDAFLRAKPGSLLVVVDTNRPDNVESQQLLDACNRVAVIDHHRRAADYIENAALNFHEPYASSTSELVSELLQYLIVPGDITAVEANALLAGIVLDTKNFKTRAGSRTFEAASYLRRIGADPMEVHRFFQDNIKTVSARYDIICQAKLYHGDVALAFLDEEAERIAAAQAADEMMNLEHVKAAFVVYPKGEKSVFISGRSLGEINVQIILEALGGGGNSTAAAASISDKSREEVQKMLLDAIDRYFEK